MNGYVRISGTQAGVPFESISCANVAEIIIDIGTNDYVNTNPPDGDSGSTGDDSSSTISSSSVTGSESSSIISSPSNSDGGDREEDVESDDMTIEQFGDDYLEIAEGAFSSITTTSMTIMLGNGINRLAFLEPTASFIVSLISDEYDNAYCSPQRPTYLVGSCGYVDISTLADVDLLLIQ
jgi:hypothetical protein